MINCFDSFNDFIGNYFDDLYPFLIFQNYQDFFVHSSLNSSEISSFNIHLQPETYTGK